MRIVREFDLVDVDMPPSAGRLIDDLDFCHLAIEFMHAPEIPLEFFVIFAGRRAYDLAVYYKVDASLSGMTAAPD